MTPDELRISLWRITGHCTTADSILSLFRDPAAFAALGEATGRADEEKEDVIETIYVVNGEEGEYSDRIDWRVRAFEREADAQAFCDAISAAAREHRTAYELWAKRRTEAVKALNLWEFGYGPIPKEFQPIVQERSAEVDRIAGPPPKFFFPGAEGQACGDMYCVEPVAISWRPLPSPPAPEENGDAK